MIIELHGPVMQMFHYIKYSAVQRKHLIRNVQEH